MQLKGLYREGSIDVSNRIFAFSSRCFLNDSSFRENTLWEHMARQSAPLRICLGTLWKTLLQLTDTSIPWFMAARWRGDPESKGIRRAAIPKPQTEEFGDMEALQRASYEREVTGCDKKNVRERKGKFVATSCWRGPRLQQRRWLSTSSAEVKGQLKGERDTRQKWACAD